MILSVCVLFTSMIVEEVWMGNICGMTADSREPNYLEICPSVTLSTTNSKWTTFRMHPGCHNEKMATDCLISHGPLMCTLGSMNISRVRDLTAMNISRVRDLTAPMHLGLKAGPLCPMSNQGSPEALLKLQMAPRLIL